MPSKNISICLHSSCAEGMWYFCRKLEFTANKEAKKSESHNRYPGSRVLHFLKVMEELRMAFKLV